jgi:hypothetical protein
VIVSTSAFEPTDAPGWYVAECGAIIVQIETGRRVVEMHVDAASAAEADYDQAEAALSSIGIAAFHRLTEIEPLLLLAEADF